MSPDDIELRVVVPRSAIPIEPPPEFYSQRNCDAQLGIGRRSFLELLRRSGAPPVTRVGSLRLVKRDAFLAYLERIRIAEEKRRVPESDLDGADGVLLELGCSPRRRTGS